MSGPSIYELEQHDGTPRYAAPAAGCAADILGLLADQRRALSASEIAQELKATRSLVHRVLGELERREFVERTHTKTYGLGVRVLEIGGAYVAAQDFSQRARRVLHELSHRTGQTANLAVLVEMDVLYVMKQEGRDSVMTVSQVGQRLPASCTALGKALLARLPDVELARWFAGAEPLPRLTSRSLATIPALGRDLEGIRRGGYAVERGEAISGRSCLAVAVRWAGAPKNLAAISVAMDDETYDEAKEVLLAELRSAGDRLDKESVSRDVMEGGLALDPKELRPTRGRTMKRTVTGEAAERRAQGG
ncbi:MAG: IclR family transcriptional regulator [Acidimicrobiales bacterium]